MQRSIYEYLAGDHKRLDDLLDRALPPSCLIDKGPYAEFRQGLLRHISIEEKIVFPQIAKLPGGEKPGQIEQLRLDHGALVSLMVPPPTPQIVRAIRSILRIHNEREENDNGVYLLFEKLINSGDSELLERLRTAPQVPVLPHNERPDVIDSTRRALARAGYNYDDY
jgi:hypothetical protein